nr:hypothetical transcript [Hymenolepis microstoma]
MKKIGFTLDLVKIVGIAVIDCLCNEATMSVIATLLTMFASEYYLMRSKRTAEITLYIIKYLMFGALTTVEKVVQLTMDTVLPKIISSAIDTILLTCLFLFESVVHSLSRNIMYLLEIIEILFKIIKELLLLNKEEQNCIITSILDFKCLCGKVPMIIKLH